jgi:pyrroline-5-carboxylate reductase
MADFVFPPIGFIGAGRMATAMIQGLLRSGLTTPDRVAASDVVPATRQALHASTRITVHATNAPIVDFAEVLVLAVKPQVMAAVLAELRPLISSRHLIISIAAGVTLAQLSADLGPACRLVRVMPNTPCLVGAGASGYCLGQNATDADASLVERFLATGGIAFRLPEKLLDAVTGLSSSGPAYVAVFIEALSDGGVRCGLPREVATALAAQTVLGTAKMLLQENLHPAMLKEMVTSPGGTTIAGLHALEHGAFRGMVMDAVEAATKRAIELGQISH